MMDILSNQITDVRILNLISSIDVPIDLPIESINNSEDEDDNSDIRVNIDIKDKQTI